jgi:diacylglycerol kinase (ATP)
MKKLVIIINGISLQKDWFYHKILPGIQAVAQAEVMESRTQQHAIALAAKAVYKGYDAIFAAGGDGTLHEVVNGVLQNHEQSKHLPPIGLIPLGSGNDFARTLSIPATAEKIIGMISRFDVREVDIGKISFIARPELPVRYFINIADVGMGPAVVKRVLESGRSLGTVASYYSSIIRTFFSYRLIPVQVQTPEWKWKGKARVVAVANGTTFGSGLCIAPDARPDDGIFACTLVGNVSLIDFLLQQGRLRTGKYARHRNIEYTSAQEVILSSEKPEVWIEADGELIGQLPVRIEIIPARLKFIKA